MSRSRKLFRLFRILLAFAAVSLLIFLVSKVGFGPMVGYLSTMHPGWLLLAFACMAANICLAALRYQRLMNTGLSFTYFLEVILASFLLNYAAMVQGLGLGAKIGMLKTRQVPVTQSSASIWLEICLDVLVCSMLVAIFLAIEFEPGSEKLLVVVIPLGIVLAASVAVALLGRVPGRFAVVDSFVQAIAEVSSLTRLSSALVYSVGIWISTAAGFYCVLNALQPDGPTDLGLSILAMTSGFLTGLVSLIPGGIGVRELTWSYVVSQGGYALELAGLGAILYRLFAIFLVAVALTVMSFARRRAA